ERKGRRDSCKRCHAPKPRLEIAPEANEEYVLGQLDHPAAFGAEGGHYDLRYGDIYLRARGIELDRDLLWIRGRVRAARRETVRWLDGGVPGHHSADKRDGIPFSVTYVYGVARGRLCVSYGALDCRLWR